MFSFPLSVGGPRAASPVYGPASRDDGVCVHVKYVDYCVSIFIFFLFSFWRYIGSSAVLVAPVRNALSVVQFVDCLNDTINECYSFPTTN